MIAEALLRKARKGDVRAISELVNRIEGKPLQAVEWEEDPIEDPVERLNELLATAQKRLEQKGTLNDR